MIHVVLPIFLFFQLNHSIIKLNINIIIICKIILYCGIDHETRLRDQTKRPDQETRPCFTLCQQNLVKVLFQDWVQIYFFFCRNFNDETLSRGLSSGAQFFLF